MGSPPRKTGTPKVEAATVDPNQIEGGTMDRSGLNQMGAELDAKLTERINARMDLVQQRVDGQMNALEREILAKLDAKPGHGALIGHTIATIGIIIAVLLTVLAIAGDRFDGGMTASGAFATQAVERERRDADLDRSITEMRRDLKQWNDAQTAQGKGTQPNVRQ